MPRAIVRWSISGEGSNVTGGKIRAALYEGGLERSGTSVCENRNGDLAEIVAAIKAALDLCVNPPGGGKLDSLWIYVDDAEVPSPADPVWAEETSGLD